MSAVHLQKMARGLKFRILEVEGLYYPCSENKGADQFRGYREADLRLCFRICKRPVYSRRGSFIKQKQLRLHPKFGFGLSGYINFFNSTTHWINVPFMIDLFYMQRFFVISVSVSKLTG